MVSINLIQICFPKGTILYSQCICFIKEEIFSVEILSRNAIPVIAYKSMNKTSLVCMYIFTVGVDLS